MITLHTDVPLDTLPAQTEEIAGHKRDEFQLAIDGDMGKLKVKTASAGWPAHDPTKLFTRYVVDVKDAAALKGIVRRAATLHKVEASFYKDAKTEAGHAVVKYHVDRKTDKEGKFVKDDTLNTDGSPKVAAAPKPGPK